MGNQAHWSVGALASIAIGTAALAQPAPLAANLQTIRSQALAGAGAFGLVEGLTTDVGPRLAATPQMALARDWAVAKLTALGFQNVHAEAFDMPMWERGEARAQIVGGSGQSLSLAALGGSVATPKGGLTAPAILFQSYDDLLAAPADVIRGKIVVVTQKMVHAQDGSGYGALTRMRRKGPSEAARKGAVAYLHRSLSTSDVRLPHTGQLDYAADAPKIPAAALAVPDAELLDRLALRGGLTLHLELTPTTTAKGQSWNVVGDLPGRAAPKEVVLLGAHLDSWDLGTGAVDDGAGVAIVITAARLAAAKQPRRTIRVVLFGAEEPNFAGPAYAKAHDKEISALSVVAKADFGAGKALRLGLPAGAAARPEFQALTRVLGPMGVLTDAEPAKHGGDDVAPLIARGAPVFSIRQDGWRYFDIHHSADDTLDKIDEADLNHAVAAFAMTAYVAAETEADLRTGKDADVASVQKRR